MNDLKKRCHHACLLFGLLFCFSVRVAADQPNFIIIFTDDQGYNDLGCFGSPNIRTPNIDRLAAEGIRFTNFYSAASVCTPSRAALLTGCYPERVGNLPVLFPHSDRGLNPDETTTAEMLRAHGYATACLGSGIWGITSHFCQRNTDSMSIMGGDASMKLAADTRLRKTWILANCCATNSKFSFCMLRTRIVGAHHGRRKKMFAM